MELNVSTLLTGALRDPVLKQYLPDLSGGMEGRTKTINRQFLFNIINSMKPEFFPANIRGLMKARKDAQAEKDKSFIEIKPVFYDLLMNSQ
jgi:hypothetical protein